MRIFNDGTALVTVVDYTEDFLYSGVLVMAIAGAMIVLTLVMVFNFTSMALRVNKLAHDVKLVEEGNLNMPIRLDGNDELTALADDVNSMRNAVVDNMTKEKQAWEANAALITAMSHDIRTPLTVVLGYLDLIELQNSDPANEEYIAACKENTMRLTYREGIKDAQYIIERAVEELNNKTWTEALEKYYRSAMVQTFYNCREQGFSLSFLRNWDIKDIKIEPIQFYVSHGRSTDAIMVVVDYQPYSAQALFTEKAYESRRVLFETVGEAVEFIVDKMYKETMKYEEALALPF